MYIHVLHTCTMYNVHTCPIPHNALEGTQLHIRRSNKVKTALKCLKDSVCKRHFQCSHSLHAQCTWCAHPSTPTGLKVKMVYTCTVLIYQEHVTRVSIHTMVFTIHYPVYRWDYKSASSHYRAAFQHWPALGLRPITLSFPLLQGLIYIAIVNRATVFHLNEFEQF